MLIALCGKSGTGKSTLVKEIEKLGYKRIVTDTTRPPRKGEKHEVDYYFDSDEEFDELLSEGEFIETTSYTVDGGEVWRYGTTRGAIAEAGEKSIIVVNPQGLRAFRDFKNPVIPVVSGLVESNEMLILSRLSKRGDLKSEIERRMEADRKDFEGINELVDFTVYNEKNTSLEELAKLIVDLAESSNKWTD